MTMGRKVQSRELHLEGRFLHRPLFGTDEVELIA